MRENVDGTRRSLLKGLAIAGVAGIGAGAVVHALEVNPNISYPDSFVLPASYVIFKDEGDASNLYKARSGSTATIDFKGSVASEVIGSVVAAIGSVGSSLAFAPGTYDIKSSLTFPANVGVALSSGAVLFVADGVAVALKGSFQAPVTQVFQLNGSGAVLLGRVHDVYPEWWGAIGDGATDDTAAVQAAINVASVGGVVRFSSGRYGINSNLIFPSNVGVAMSGGAILSVANGVSVALKGSFQAPVTQVFQLNGSGVVLIDRLHDVYPEWWGATGDGITDDTAAVQAAINEAAAGGVVRLSSKWYSCAGGLNIPKRPASPDHWNDVTQISNWNLDLTLRGSGQNATQLETIYIISDLIGEGSSGFQEGQYAGRVQIEDMGVSIINGNPPGGILANFTNIELFQKNVLWQFRSINPSNHITCLHCGGFAGPSQPVVWESVNIFVALANGGVVVWQWYEGFTWRGGTINPSSDVGQYGGIYCGGETTLEQIDSAIVLGGHWSYFVEGNAGPQTYVNIEWPNNDECLGGGVIGTSAPTTIISPQGSQGNYFKPKISVLFFQPPVAFKTIGCSLGLMATPFFVPPQSGQAVIGAANTSAAPVANTDYRCNTDLRVVVSGGTDVSISLLDDYGNTMASGLTSLGSESSPYLMGCGEHINFGGFSVAPTVRVFQVSG